VLRVSTLTRELSPAAILGAVVLSAPRLRNALFGRAEATTAGVVRAFDTTAALPGSFERPLRGIAGFGATLPIAPVVPFLAVGGSVDAEGTRADAAVEGRELGTDLSGS
jgi:hypothetical protein